MVWSQQEIHTLIKIRKDTNQFYWKLLKCLRHTTYWNIVANRLNNICDSHYLGNQCKRKFKGLVDIYNNIELHAANGQKKRKCQAYRIFFNELGTRFWEGPLADDTTQKKRNIRERRKRKGRSRKGGDDGNSCGKV